MKKASKILLSLMAFLLIISFSVVVNAHSVELDPDGLIFFPFLIINGEGNIDISTTETNYTLFYQAVEIPNDIYDQIKNIESEGEVALDAIDVELDTLNADCENLETIYDEAYEKYNSLIEGAVEGSELETARTEYETAKTNYENKVAEYNNKVKEYNDKVNEVNKNIAELTPMYDDGAWQETENGDFKIDISTFSGTKAFALWARLDKQDGTTVYDEIICTTEGTMQEEVNVTSVKLNRTELSLTVGRDYTLIATISPDDATDKTLIWSSDNEEVATVEDGKVTAIGPGTATITVRTNDGNFEDTCKVIVTNDISIDDPNIDNNDNNNDNNNDGSKDPTIAGGKIPQTGKSFIFGSIIAILSVISVIFYKKMKRYNFKQ